MKNWILSKWIKRAMPFAMSLMVALGLCTSALAYSGRTMNAYKATAAITIDGDLGEWNTTSHAVVTEEEQVIRDRGQWTGPEDCAMEVYLMWDDSNLYLGAKILDDTPFMYREGFPPDMADSLVLLISTDPDADAARGEYAANDFRLTMIVDDYYFNTGIDRDMIANNMGFASRGADGDEQVIDGYECAVMEIDGGYTFEALIPFATFANENIPVLVPQAGMVLGVDFGLFDLDFPCPGVATVRIEWSANADADSNPSLWGTVTFCE